MIILWDVLIERIHKASAKKKDGDMDWKKRIVVDEKILVGKPVVKGTRLSIEFIMDLLAQEWTEQDILKNYPGLTHEDIVACYWYAGEVLKTERVYTLETEHADTR